MYPTHLTGACTPHILQDHVPHSTARAALWHGAASSPDGQAGGAEPALGFNTEMHFSGGWIWGIPNSGCASQWQKGQAEPFPLHTQSLLHLCPSHCSTGCSREMGERKMSGIRQKHGAGFALQRGPWWSSNAECSMSVL